ncbi:hypothetical protein CHU98_g9659 [Xylaria longipes]|nr:hypothetical protein CHU98_g9659 [Xylaria longipes]
MSIWDDAGAIPPVLDDLRLQAYRTGNPDIINAEEPRSGLTPLAKALLSGNASIVTLLLKNGASPDKKTKDGRTPMYLAADAPRGRGRMVQVLLDNNPAPTTFDDEGPDFVQKNTPLMAAVKRDDPEAVKLLVERGASKEKKNSAGETARDLVDESKPNKDRVKKALEIVPSKGVGGLMTYIKGWVLPVLAYFKRFSPLADIWDAASRAIFGLATPGPLPGEDVSEPKNAEEFKQNLENMVKRGGLEKIFGPDNPYVQQVAEKAAELQNDPKNLLNSPAQIDALAKLALYQPILYCDDSGSMWNEDNGPGTNKGDRWNSQIALVKKMTEITTRAVPNNRGCHLRFINRDTPDNNNLDANAIEQVFNNYGRGTGWTPIGTMLRNHVLDQIVYKELNNSAKIKYPFLVMCITDGFPTQEAGITPGLPEDENQNQDADRFRKELRMCAKLLEEKDHKQEVVRFCLSRLGNIVDWEDRRNADQFWDGLKSDPDIQDVLYMTEDILDEKFQTKQDQKDLEVWLLTTLLSPLQSVLY